MTPIEEAKALWRKCGDLALPLFVSERVQIANSFKAMIELAKRGEQLDAFKQDVSDAVTDWKRRCGFTHETQFDRFILPKPVDPVLDGLALAVEDVLGTVIGDADVVALREALEARGVKVGADVA